MHGEHNASMDRQIFYFHKNHGLATVLNNESALEPI